MDAATLSCLRSSHDAFGRVLIPCITARMGSELAPCFLCLGVLACLLLGSSSAPAGYLAMNDTDCGYPVCRTFLNDRVPCGMDEPKPCNVTVLAQVCNATPGCQGFNINGWLKGCLPRFCPSAGAGMETVPGCKLFVRMAPAPPLPPPEPVPDVDDIHYPSAEREENLSAVAPKVVAADAVKQTCSLRQASSSGGGVADVKVGQFAFGHWLVAAVYSPPNGTMVVLERRFAQWGLLLYL